MPDAVVFTGPSINFEEAERILPRDYEGYSVEYLPPVKRGVLMPLISAERPKIITIIDGLFNQDASVGHREILSVLKAGITVYGASSMGALRACELEPFGMQGFGKVYQMYADGIIESDDEVALACDPDTNAAVSEALVDIRLNLDCCAESGIVSRESADAVLKAASDVYYPRRTFIRAVHDAEKAGLIDKAASEALNLYCSEKWFSQKHLDAVFVLEKTREYLKNL